MSQDQQKYKIKFVAIPYDLSEPIQELEYIVNKKTEVEGFLDKLKLHFGKVKKNDAQLKQQIESLKQQLAQKHKGSEQVIDDEVFRTASISQMVETVPMQLNIKETNYVGVNLYIDDSGSIKNLPMNTRACDFTYSCGRPSEIRGDTFVSRFFDNDDEFQRLDFTINDLSSSQEWVQKANKFNAKHKQKSPKELYNTLEIQTQMSKGQSPASKNLVDKTVQELNKQQSNAEIINSLGNDEFKKQNYKEAIARYTEVLEEDPNFYNAYNNRALCYIKTQVSCLAVQDCDVVIQKIGQVIRSNSSAPSSLNVSRTLSKAYYRRGLAKENIHQKEAAMEDFFCAFKFTGSKETKAKLDQITQELQQVHSQTEGPV